MHSQRRGLCTAAVRKQLQSMAGSIYKQQGSSHAATRRETAGFQSDVPTLYTRGGIKYDKTDVTQSVKGWSDEGISRFNELFDQVKKDRGANPGFGRKWLEARKSAQEEEGATAKKRKRQPTQARSELFESDNDKDIAPITDEAPVGDSGSESEDN
jgi:hypothetical protein